MERVQFNYTLSSEAQQEKQRLVQHLMKNADIRDLMKRYPQIDEAFIYAHSGRLQDYVHTMEKCKNCKGLDFCTQATKGHRLGLKYDGFLMNEQCRCAYQEKKEQFLRLKKRYVEADLADAYFHIDISAIDVRKESDEYKSAYTKILRMISEAQPEKGVYLSGKPGAGKTYLAAGVANYYVKEGKRVAFVSVPKLIADLKMLFHDALAFEQRLGRIKRADVLVLDDIGGENLSAWSRDDILLPLLDARMEQHRLTLFTSNYSMVELKERLETTSRGVREPDAAERLFERLKTLSSEIFIKGDSRRK